MFTITQRGAIAFTATAVVVLTAVFAPVYANVSLQTEESVARTANSTLTWSTRPNLYFGTRPRYPESLLTGLMWFGLNDFQNWLRPRHSCEQADNFAGYGYTRNDGRSFGEQVLNDKANNVTIKTEFVKLPGGSHGGDWAVRISGKSYAPGTEAIIGIQYYAGLEGLGSLRLEKEDKDMGLKTPVLLGNTPDLGDFSMRIVNGERCSPPATTFAGEDHDLITIDRTQYAGVAVGGKEVWRASEIMEKITYLKAKSILDKYEGRPMPGPMHTIGLPNIAAPSSNFFIFQKTLVTPFEFDVIYNSYSAPARLEAANVATSIEAARQKFDKRFEKTFKLTKKGYNSDEIDFAKACMSNLIGGIGYFYGDSIVDKAVVDEEEDFYNRHDDWVPTGVVRKPVAPEFTKPMSLYTAVPSRPFFPRGFFWDEGFHQILIGKWDNDLSLDIIQHWINLIDEDGWIAREQILGDEARSKVPKEFQTQFRDFANPPTLFLAIRGYMERLSPKSEGYVDIPVGDQVVMAMTTTDDIDVVANRQLSDPELSKRYLQKIYSRLRRNYKWFRRTQTGMIKEWQHKAKNNEAYRWRGRTENHTLTSGLDDYPRAAPPHIGELHVDLLCWMGMMADTLKQISERIGETGDSVEYQKVYDDILVNLDELHWNEEEQMYCDLTADRYDESEFVCHKGYISLFPMLLGLLPPDSPKLEAIFNMMHDSNYLWSNYGLRSLSMQDAYYGHGENYWRGPIWININYLALSSLYKNYVNAEGPYQGQAKKIYTDLRTNIVNTIYKEYKSTGYVYEQYLPDSGKGHRSHPFTGWTALVTLIMAEDY